MSKIDVMCAIVDESLPVKREMYGSISITDNGKGFSFKLDLRPCQVNWRMSATPQYKRLSDRKMEQQYSFQGVEVIHLNGHKVTFYGDRPTIRCRMLFDSSDLLKALLAKPKDYNGFRIFQEVDQTLLSEGFTAQQLDQLRDSLEEPRIVPALPAPLTKFTIWINPKNSQHPLGPYKSKMPRLHEMWDHEETVLYGHFLIVARLVRKQLSAYQERIAREAAEEEERQMQLANHQHGLWCGLKKSVSKNFTKVFRK